ncbi:MULTISPECIES: DUF1287 domain-containing protein [Agathobacter]|uniref:DUF1287 domain-containing protein n=1 Tax=Agathobacter ruminis TaxID=1712665 RepID=A0A2G3E563_9FIRM|nr:MULTISPECIES: DUF1287 domain-containing protein [Agathobacter]MBQ1682091.1 DUF1287 domain-containing protein [Agathobacter sp.]MDC7302325.1 DUF1287 domain-containing protein [Agathobacter ruminis]PHU38409.1 DUF1287 domain-containing protein [Agathobacter ruminis]
MEKRKTLILVIIVSIMLAACSFLLFYLLRYQNTSASRMQNKYEGDIIAIRSTVDFDADGVDDQTDILDNAIEYVGTRPKYKSVYYASGYPDDEYGVCTDVVARALLGSGYDLQELVNRDIHEHPEDYDITKPDANIDFRRVKNLKVFFDHTAISLTLDPKEIDQWQGGDIVVYEHHVGIISDRRNRDGIPYLIHHSGEYQRYYEQDMLEKWPGKIIGHYRISE